MQCERTGKWQPGKHANVQRHSHCCKVSCKCLRAAVRFSVISIGFIAALYSDQDIAVTASVIGVVFVGSDIINAFCTIEQNAFVFIHHEFLLPFRGREIMIRLVTVIPQMR